MERVSKNHYDFCGWATMNDIRCKDGRTIRKNAFRANHDQIVPLVWNHQHNDVSNILGHALLENRPEGVYTYGLFNDTQDGQSAKLLVQHGDIDSLSIFANDLKQMNGDVLHGAIREVSLVIAGANPGAHIDSVMAHSDGYESDTEAWIYSGEPIELFHAESFEEHEPEEIVDEPAEEETQENIEGEEPEMNEEQLSHSDESEETVQDVFDSLSEKQKTVVYAVIGQALADKGEDEDSEGGENMKHNAFEGRAVAQENVLSHADQTAIIELARSSGVGSLQKALDIYAEENDTLAHSFEDMGELFPEYKQLMPGAPELITRDQTWVDGVIAGVHKSPYTRIKTRQANAKVDALKAKGYKKGEKKQYMEKINLIQRSTDPQTIYVKDKLDRDDILDITDFDAVEYNWGIMNMVLKETLAMAIMVGDGRDETDPDKIHENHIRPIWKDHNLYTMHKDVDLAAAKKTLQGTNTSLYFSDNYVYAEAIIEAALYAREQYKGSGKPAFYCDPHLVNVMLLARDRNGRRIYETVNDLVAALNVSKIETAEQFAGLTRTTEVAKGDAKDGETKQLLGLFVNLNDYTYGCTKGGQITRFNQFDIDYNQEKMLIETRGSGALNRIQSAIALELPVEAVEEEDDEMDMEP